MKKHILLKTVLLFVFSIFLLQGCREESVAIENQNIKAKISHKTFSDFNTNEGLMNEIKKVKSIATKSKFDKNSQDVLNVNLNDALFIEDTTNNKHSYIFKIANNSYDIKNLVLAYNSSGNYDAYLVNYSLTKEERNLFVSGHNVDMRNKTTITPIDKNKINFNSKTSGTCYELIKYQEDCICHTSHASGGCTHPDTVYDLMEVPCVGGSATGDSGTGDQGGTTYGTGSSSTETGGSYIPNVLVTPNGEPIEILANSINSILDMSLSGSELLWLNSNTEFADGIWNMLSNDNSEATKNFATWGISFAATNNISWTQFKNWFINADGTTKITFDSTLNSSNAKTVTNQEFINFLNSQSGSNGVGELIGNNYYLKYDLPSYTGGIDFELGHTKDTSNKFIAKSISSTQYGISLTWSWEQLPNPQLITSDPYINKFIVSGNVKAKFVYIDLGIIYTAKKVFEFRTDKNDGICRFIWAH